MSVNITLERKWEEIELWLHTTGLCVRDGSIFTPAPHARLLFNALRTLRATGEWSPVQVLRLQHLLSTVHDQEMQARFDLIEARQKNPLPQAGDLST